MMYCIIYEAKGGGLGRTHIAAGSAGAAETLVYEWADAGKLPSLPWLNHMVVEPDAEAATCDLGWLTVDWDAGKSMVAEPSATTDELIAGLASIRFEAETGGVTVSGMEIMTDRESQAKILAVRVKAAADPDFSTTWKALNGWFALNAATIVALSDAVLAHVAACFQAEEAVAAAIDAGEVTTRAGVDAAFVAARGA
ncbi:DUF4376 domain-containing protein [Breoghania sp.]|uniref:DUF4376 domain-containing protein n=1 Tax=Breoghania sp. TaxID=2065378 RepID=UPI002AA76D08|nr:DUF4376 domain-containing protein [Breoghania sp.]